MPINRFIYGFQKRWIDLRLLIRLYTKAIFYFGLHKAFKEIHHYIKDERNLFSTNTNRYLKSEKEIIAVPDMPPINSKTFIQYVIKDIEWINHNKTPLLVFAIICITSKCPFKCPYCYNSDLHSENERLNINTIIKTINSLIKKGTISIYLSGGEPLMRWEGLIQILRNFKNKNIRFWLLSTGWNLDSQKLSILKNEGLKGVMISLDSFNPESINSIKGSHNAFNNAINAIQEANQIGLIVAIDCVFGRTLLKKENFMKHIEQSGYYGAHFINCYSPRQMHHILEKEYDNFNLPEFERLEKLTKENQRSTSYRNLPITYSPDIWEAKRGCVGGKLFIYIDPAGNVKSCPFVDQSYGNIQEKDILKILDEMKNNKSENICATNQLLSKNT